MSPNEFGNLVAGPGELSREESAASDLGMFVTTRSNLNVWKVHPRHQMFSQSPEFSPNQPRILHEGGYAGVKYGV
jgi:hypothetical protein